MANRSNQAGIAELLWLFFSPFGRVSRFPYWLALAVLFSVSYFLGGIWERTLEFQTAADGTVETVRMTDASLNVLMAMLPVQWCFIALLAKRSRDRGWPGLISALWVLPLLNIAVALYLGLFPGDPGPNRYGADRDRPPN